MTRDKRRRSRSGHIDNSVVFWIVPILVLVAGSYLSRATTGQSPIGLWQDLPGDVRSFSIGAPLMLIGAVILAVIGAVASGDGVRSRRKDDRIYIGLGGLAPRAFGLGLMALAIYMGWAGVEGEGAFWWIVLVLALLVGFAGASLAGTGNRIVVEPGRIAHQTTFYGAGMGGEEHEIASFPAADVSVTEQRSGGAFGQPLRFTYTVSVDSSPVHTEETSQSRAEAISAALSEAMSQLAEGTSPGATGDSPASSP